MKIDLEKQHGSMEQAIGRLEDSHVAAQREQESTARRARQSHDELASTRDENARRREELTKLVTMADTIGGQSIAFLGAGAASSDATSAAFYAVTDTNGVYTVAIG